ncbi:hypothetical protein D3C72_1934400 [compost metagenome]
MRPPICTKLRRSTEISFKLWSVASPGRARAASALPSSPSNALTARVKARSGRVISANAVKPATSPSKATRAIDHSVVRNTELRDTDIASASCACPCSTTYT